MSGSGISWAVCKCAPCSRQITTPAPHRSIFTGRMPFLPPNQQRQSTEGRALKASHTQMDRKTQLDRRGIAMQNKPVYSNVCHVNILHRWTGVHKNCCTSKPQNIPIHSKLITLSHFHPQMPAIHAIQQFLHDLKSNACVCLCLHFAATRLDMLQVHLAALYKAAPKFSQ